MSNVTSVIIVCPSNQVRRRGFEKFGDTWISEVNNWLRKNISYAIEEYDYPLFRKVSEETAGHKHPQSDTYIGGFNFFPIKDFVEFFESLHWPLAQLLICNTDSWDDTPHLIFPLPEKKYYERAGFSIPE